MNQGDIRDYTTTTAVSPGPIIDADSFNALWEGPDDPFFLRIARLFLVEQGDRIASLVKGLDDGDLGAVARDAHSMKSSAGYVGALPLQEAAREVERTARVADAAQLQPLVGRLRTLSHATLEHVQGMIAGQRG